MKHPLSIVVIEDNLGDIELFNYILKDYDKPFTLQTISTFKEADTFIQGLIDQPVYYHKLIVFMDLNMDSQNGIQLIKKLKGHPTTRSVPLIVTTTSESPYDIAQAYQTFANCYLLKDTDFNAYRHRVLKTLEFWHTISLIAPINLHKAVKNHD